MLMPITADAPRTGAASPCEGQYCDGLVGLLGLARERGIGIVEGFARFADFLSEMVSLSPQAARARYPDPSLYEFRAGRPGELLDACALHRASHARGLREAPVLLLVHPFAPYLRRWDARADVVPYGFADERGAMKVLDALDLAKREGFCTALLEDPVSYALASARLAQEGRVDDVFFSKHRWGEALDPGAYARIPPVPLAIAGAYVQSCVRSALGELCATSASEIALIEELCVAWPYERASLRGEARMCATASGRAIGVVERGHVAGYLRETVSRTRA